MLKYIVGFVVGALLSFILIALSLRDGFSELSSSELKGVAKLFPHMVESIEKKRSLNQ